MILRISLKARENFKGYLSQILECWFMMKLLLVCEEIKIIRLIFCLFIQRMVFTLNGLFFILRWSFLVFLVEIFFLLQNNDSTLDGSVFLFFFFSFMHRFLKPLAVKNKMANLCLSPSFLQFCWSLKSKI